MVGTFYRAPAPGQPPFVEPGDTVAAGDAVGIIEVMKLFNSVTAGVDGTVAEVLAENGAAVAHGQRLVAIEPAAGDAAP
jgi:acetyl-CoA carboxylase biotin carboxyl carrier protein